MLFVLLTQEENMGQGIPCRNCGWMQASHTEYEDHSKGICATYEPIEQEKQDEQRTRRREFRHSWLKILGMKKVPLDF
jgi:hypothetical protein